MAYEAIRKNHLAIFKVNVAMSVLRDDAPISQLAVKYSLNDIIIHRWKCETLASMEARVFRKA